MPQRRLFLARAARVGGNGAFAGSEGRTTARDEAAAKDVTINGLPILAFEPDLDMYFRDYVIGGPGAFMIVAKDFESFSR